MKAYCHNCNRETEYIIIHEAAVLQGIKAIKYTAKVPYCSECKQKMFVREIEGENLDKLAMAIWEVS